MSTVRHLLMAQFHSGSSSVDHCSAATCWKKSSGIRWCPYRFTAQTKQGSTDKLCIKTTINMELK